jgi:hypothetical protein
MTTDMLIQVVTPVLARYSMEAKKDGASIRIFDKKRQYAGYISSDGDVQAAKVGMRTMLGSLVRNDLRAAISAATPIEDPKTLAISQIRDLMAAHGITMADLT